MRVALASDIRIDGRACNQRRTSEVKPNILDNLAGSSYVSLDHGKCEIYTGIKIKVSSDSEGERPPSPVFLELSSMRKLTKEQTSTLVYLQQLIETHFIRKEAKGFTQLCIPNSKKHYL